MDYSNVTQDSKREDWKGMIKALNSGEKVKISENVYYYFLEVLPPKNMFNGGFLFAEGWENLKKFTQEKDEFFAQKTAKVWMGD